MIAIFPAIPRGTFDKELLSNSSGNRAMQGLSLARELAVRGVTVYLMLEDPTILGDADVTGLHVFASGSPDGKGEFFLQGTRDALRYLLEMKLVAPFDAVAVLDYHNTLLTSDTVVRALDQARAQPDSLIASMETTRDYPAQFDVPLRLLAVQTFVFKAPPASWPKLSSHFGLPKTLAFSQPLFWDWSSFDIWDGDGHFFAYASSAPFQPRDFHKIEPQKALTSLAEGLPVLVREGALSARLVLLPEAATQNPLQALSPLGGDAGFPVTIKRESPDGEAVAELHQLTGGPEWLLQFWTAEEGAVGGGEIIEIGASRPIRLGMVKDWCNLALLQAGSTSDVDFMVPVSCLDGVWTVDPFTGERLQPKSGQPLKQRQDMPKLHTLDLALLAGRAEMIANYDDVSQPFIPIFLTMPEKIKIASEIDMLRLEPGGRP